MELKFWRSKLPKLIQFIVSFKMKLYRNVICWLHLRLLTCPEKRVQERTGAPKWFDTRSICFIREHRAHLFNHIGSETRLSPSDDANAAYPRTSLYSYIISFPIQNVVVHSIWASVYINTLFQCSFYCGFLLHSLFIDARYVIFH